MMKRDNKTYRNWLCLLWLAVFTSCMDETFTASDVEGTFISIRGMAPHTGSVHSGTPEDYIIHTLRVLAFDKTTGDKVTNLFYNAHSGDIIRHPIDAGSYDFVFLANEPAYQSVRTLLDAITHYGDLNHIAYPADFFSSEQIIPMMQEIKNVTVLSGGQGATLEAVSYTHLDVYKRQTLWSGEFIETGGATIAQVLYMLGVEPIRDTFGRVTDLRLIPSAELGRPRIDVVVQTSGQLRDIAASRLFLINRAVEMAANAKEDQFENQVAAGVVEAERVLIEKGLTPKEAREMSTFRVFGGVNGNYGTGIQLSLIHI